MRDCSNENYLNVEIYYKNSVEFNWRTILGRKLISILSVCYKPKTLQIFRSEVSDPFGLDGPRLGDIYVSR